MKRIVIDTNLLVASFFNKMSFSFKIVGLAKKRKIKILWSDKTREEAEFILSKIRRATDKTKKEKNFLTDVFKDKNKVNVVKEVRGISEDPADDKFFSCALAGEADMIISSDNDLLSVGQFEGIPILKPSSAWKILQK